MRWQFLITLILVAVVSAATAEAVTPRTAEHDGFTRIVIDTDQPDDVSVRQVSNSLIITLPPSAEKIETKDFFRRISRARIAGLNVKQELHQIELKLNCDCKFVRSQVGSSMLVIDLSARDASETLDLDRSPSPTWGMTAPISKSALRFGNVSAEKELKTSEDQPIPAEPALFTARLTPPDRSEVLDNSSQRRLLANLNAASKMMEGTSAQRGQNRTDDQITFRSELTQQGDTLQEVEQRAQQTFGTCESELHLNPASWLSYENALSYLSEQRGQALAPNNELDDRALRKLAKAYLSLAMGAEAGALLRSLSNPVQADDELITLSSFIDGEMRMPLSATIPDILRCSELLMWRLLETAENTDDPSSGIDLSEEQLKQVRDDFDRWPEALRGIFGAPLAKALADIGAADTAAFSLRRAASDAELLSGDRAMTAASIAQSNDDRVSAIELLEPIISADDDKAPNAVIALSDIVHEQGQTLKPDQVSALESYREEYKGTVLESELIRTQLRVALEAKNFERALELAEDYSKIAKPHQVELVLDEIGEGINALESDAAFLKEAVSLPEKSFARIAQGIRVQMRDRVKGLGFPELATQLGATRKREKLVDGQTTNLNEKTATINADDGNSSQPLPDGKDDVRSATKGEQDDALGGLKAETTQRDNKPADTTNLNEAPIAKAVRQTNDLLSNIAELKQDLEKLGL